MAATYSPWLVALSIVVAVLVSFLALRLASRIVESNPLVGRVWLMAGALAMGLGIWSMHFIGMLALSLPIPLSYDVTLTLASLLIAILTSGFAIRISSGGELHLQRHLLCSLVMGVGIAAMHYTGMAAIRVMPGIGYDPLLVAASIAIAIVASFAALWLTFRLRSAAHRLVWLARLAAALVMGAAIAGMHYTGMAAAMFSPGSICLGGLTLDNTWLALSIGVVTMGLMAIMLMSAVFDAHLKSRTRAYQGRLLEVNAQLKHQATHDVLTELPNRSLFVECLAQALLNARAEGTSCAVLMVDLDRFKPINDTLGHGAGDAVLRKVAQQLLSSIRESDMAARMGGDEFMVLMRNATVESCTAVAARIIENVGKPCIVRAVELQVTPSIGITLFPGDDSSAEILIAHADEAMYAVKQAGGNGCQFFIAGGRRHSVERLQLETDLRQAVEQAQVQLHYQPQLDVATGRIVGFEALARWQHPVRGAIPPDRFIPMAEAIGVIVPLGRWILFEACRQLREWQDAGLEHLRIAVNLSAKQFLQPDLVPMIGEALSSHGIRPQMLELELTETVVMTNSARALDILAELQQLGVHVAIDDFGTGHSSMNTLRRLPITKLKIDRSLVQDLGTDARCDVIVRAVVWLGHGLGQQVVAEGVETANQLACLRAFGCDQFQGYLCSRALAPLDVLEFVARYAQHRGAVGPPEGLLEAGGLSL